MPREPAPAQQGMPLPLHCLDQIETVADLSGRACPFRRTKSGHAAISRCLAGSCRGWRISVARCSGCPIPFTSVSTIGPGRLSILRVPSDSMSSESKIFRRIIHKKCVLREKIS